ncbi:hypothetical protein GGX14DRAFT_401919 [Mycena pura]|uniref:Uncharacterized protein n=1 Tax=Mycena pura TaxID=153505 RepID=A0AAD6Y623_9AGAR|nr:hypothetical protein GGX14DRAFT_401919 [Mycena pura]
MYAAWISVQRAKGEEVLTTDRLVEGFQQVKTGCGSTLRLEFRHEFLRDAIMKQDINSVDLKLVSFSDWNIELESSANTIPSQPPGVKTSICCYESLSLNISVGRRRSWDQLLAGPTKTQAVSSAVGEAKSIGTDQVEASRPPPVALEHSHCGDDISVFGFKLKPD